jgi:HK97 family phage prohead protease
MPWTFNGYASVFYREGDPATEYELRAAGPRGPRVVERIMPGAFDRAVREDDVIGKCWHRDRLQLGSVKAGTLRLAVDDVGLWYEIDAADSDLADLIAAAVESGTIAGSSFSFRSRSTVARSEAGCTIVERHEVQLFDVGPTLLPAYRGTTAGVKWVGPDRPAHEGILLRDWDG